MSKGQRDRIGATRGKLALVGVLALVFVAVLWSNFAGSGEELQLVAAAKSGPQPSAASGATPAAAKPADADVNGPFGKFAVDGDWRRAPLDQDCEFRSACRPALDGRGRACGG